MRQSEIRCNKLEKRKKRNYYIFNVMVIAVVILFAIVAYKAFKDMAMESLGDQMNTYSHYEMYKNNNHFTSDCDD